MGNFPYTERVKHLLYVIANTTETDASRQLLLLATHLSPEDFQIHVVCPTGPLATSMRRASITVHDIPAQTRLRTAVGNLRQIIRTVKPDLIHAHGTRGGLWARLASRGSKIPVVYTEHLWTSDFRLGDPIRNQAQLFALRLLDRWTAHTVAVSEAVAHFLLREEITKADKLSTIYGAIEPSEPLPAVSPLHIGTLGRLTPIKGTETLLQAVALLAADFPDLRCHIGGDGPEKKRLHALAKRLKVSGQIVWHGHLKERATFFKEIGLYVQPSFSESFGMTPLEAMAAGRPVIVSDAGALPELIEQGADGHSFPRGNAAALAETLRKLITNPDDYARLRDAGLHRATFFTPERMANQYAQLYARLCN